MVEQRKLAIETGTVRAEALRINRRHQTARGDARKDEF
jgi:hypothetical protein